MTPRISFLSVIGKANALCRPSFTATVFRGKLVSFVTSAIQTGLPLAQTRPGNPTPGENGACRLNVSNPVILGGDVFQTSTQRSTLDCVSTLQNTPISQSRASHTV